MGGGDTAHGGPPRLVSPPTGDTEFQICFFRENCTEITE